MSSILEIIEDWKIVQHTPLTALRGFYNWSLNEYFSVHRFIHIVIYIWVQKQSHQILLEVNLLLLFSIPKMVHISTYKTCSSTVSCLPFQQQKRATQLLHCYWDMNRGTCWPALLGGPWEVAGLFSRWPGNFCAVTAQVSKLQHLWDRK